MRKERGKGEGTKERTDGEGGIIRGRRLIERQLLFQEIAVKTIITRYKGVGGQYVTHNTLSLNWVIHYKGNMSGT